jgi:outer membrane protein assembly factor BamD
MIKPVLFDYAPFRRFSILAAAALCLALSSACGNRDDAVIDIGAEQLYQEGREHMLNGNYAGAELSLRNLSIRYPFSPQARQAQLDMLYVYYKSRKPEEALDVARTFRREYPTSPDVAYCLYMMGRIYFDKEPNMLERLFRVDVSRRPPDESVLAFSTFQELIRLFPDSQYVTDARERMIFLRNRLATYENHVARYYLTRGAHVAAANRAKYAIEHYPGAPQLEESLAIMIEAYNAQGMTDLARDAERVLEENFGSADIDG